MVKFKDCGVWHGKPLRRPALLPLFCKRDAIKQWLGHSQNLIAQYGRIVKEILEYLR